MKRIYLFLFLILTLPLFGQTLRKYNISASWYRVFNCEPTFKTECDSIWFYSTTASKPSLYIHNDNDNNTAGEIQFYKDSDTPADNDPLGYVRFYGKDGGGTKTQFGYLIGRSADVTDGDEAGFVNLYVLMDGSAYSAVAANGYLGSVVGNGEVVINDNSANFDFRVETDGETDAFIVQGEGSQITTNIDTISFEGSSSEVLFYVPNDVLRVHANALTFTGSSSGIYNFNESNANTTILFQSQAEDSAFVIKGTGGYILMNAAMFYANANVEINCEKSSDSLLVVYNDIIGRDSSFVILPTGAIKSVNFQADNKLTACATNAGALDFSGASKTLTVEDDAIVDQDLTSDADVTFGSLTVSSLKFVGSQNATYDASAGDVWFSLAGDGTDTLWVSIDGSNAVSWVGAARQVKH